MPPGLAALNTGDAAAVTSVSCPSAGNCTAGGFYQTNVLDPDDALPVEAFVVNHASGKWGQAAEVPGSPQSHHRMWPQDHASMITFSCRMTSTASITGPGSTDLPPSRPDAAHEGNGAASSTPFLAVRGPVQSAAQVEIVVPVKDEETDLAPSIRRLHAYLSGGFPLTWHITIADNASTDGTWAIADGLAAELPRVCAVHLDARAGAGPCAPCGRERRRVVAYMDVDLSTDLDALLPLVAPLLSGHSDLAIGTRLARGVPRRARPQARSDLPLLQPAAPPRSGPGSATRSAGSRRARRDGRALLPLSQDGGWFFDTELLVLAERAGLRIHEVPVDWTDDPDSRVDVWRTAAWPDIRGIRAGSGRPGHAAWPGSCAVGVPSTVRLHPALPTAARAARRRRRPMRQPAAHRHRQHRRQPPLHLRLAGPRPAVRHQLAA